MIIPGDRVVYKDKTDRYGNWGTVVELAKEHVGSSIATPPDGYTWVAWDGSHRVSLIQAKDLMVVGRKLNAGMV